MAAAASTPAPAAMQMHDDVDLANQPASAPATPISGADWSIVSHRMAGVIILGWGLTALIAGLQWPRRTWFRFVPPLVLLALAEFLFLRNDPKAWPNGPIGFWVSFQDPNAFQHRIFVVLVVAIAVIELLRAADRLPRVLALFALPGVVAFGALLLFFHQHGGFGAHHLMTMSGPSMAADPAMQSMAMSTGKVKLEHLFISICGLGVAVSRLLADGGILKGRLGATLWTTFVIALGGSMLFFVE